MAKQIRFLLLVILFSLTLLPMTSVAAQSGNYQEGAHLFVGAANTVSSRTVTIHAVKTINGKSRSAVFELTLTCSTIAQHYQVGPVTLEVPIDVDYLSVSRDLGWAGLDANVTAFEQYSQTTVPIEIHIAWWATAGVTESGGQFQRQARFEGTIISPGCAFFNLASDYQSHLVSRSAYIFSSREPKPRY